MQADDFPAEITKAVYQHPIAKVPQNVFADLLAIAWPQIEQRIREQVNSEIETRLVSFVAGEDPAAEGALETAALIALTGDPYAEPSREPTPAPSTSSVAASSESEGEGDEQQPLDGFPAVCPWCEATQQNCSLCHVDMY